MNLDTRLAKLEEKAGTQPVHYVFAVFPHELDQMIAEARQVRPGCHIIGISWKG
jgi:hypothetical protein